MQSLKTEEGFVDPSVLFHAQDVLVSVLEGTGDQADFGALQENRPMAFIEESGAKYVSFCGQKFCANDMLKLPSVPGYEAPELTEFRCLVKRLDTLAGELAGRDAAKETASVFVSYDKSLRFMEALNRIAQLTSWQLKFMPSDINPGKGVEVSVVVPS